MSEAFRLLGAATQTDSSVLLCGESGTGKELAARAIHDGGPRYRGPFVALNCAAVPMTLFESELFGYTRGAFSGAVGNRKGYFQLADQGTLLLDEVGELEPECQAKLLRVLEAGEVRPVGAESVVRFDVRVIAATNRDLHAAVRAGRFRSDLFYRLGVIEVRIAPLRERPEDVSVIVRELIGKRPVRISGEAMALLERYPWPGNGRELANEIERAIVLGGGEIDTQVLSAAVRTGEPGRGPRLLRPGAPVLVSQGGSEKLSDLLGEAEKAIIASALQASGGSRAAAAHRLGIGRTKLYKKMALYGIR
ncbi:MAG: sigma 54-interacting transcriptional regulator [Deltaproteobacteria bacterium]|nr:sigma 54-interacting transcriptional regulator [Deltaproteobacteria bacterium]